MKNLTKNPIEGNPFNKNKLFKFNPDKQVNRKSSFGTPLEPTFAKSHTNLNKIVEDAPYKYSSDKYLGRHLFNCEKSSFNYVDLNLSKDSDDSFKE